MDVLSGRVQSVIFNSDDFYVLSFKPVQGLPARVVKVRGNIFGISIVQGTPIQLMGKWTVHPKYGSQFLTHDWTPWAEDNQDVFNFLYHSCTGFLTTKFTEPLVNKYGKDTFEALTSKPEEILEFARTLKDVSDDIVMNALDSWARLQALMDLASFLRGTKLPSRLIWAALAEFGSEASQKVRENPYILLSIDGFEFDVVDAIATERLGIPLGDPRRVGGGVLCAARMVTREGHLFIRKQEIPSKLVDIFKGKGTFTSEAIDKTLQAFAEDKLLVIEEGTNVYLPKYHQFEKGSAERLARFLTPHEIDVDVNKFLESYQSAHKIELSDAQREGIEKILHSRVLVVTGLPGTGKTTMVKTIVNLFDTAGVDYLLMAPTGIAAKRLSSVTGRDAATIHRSLKFDGMNWGNNSRNRLLVDAVIVDEMSMVDQELFFRLLDALPPTTILVLVGDSAQLPSVGPGNVLRELVACKDIPHVRLTQIFRQAERSAIVLNSHRVNRGEKLQLADIPKESDFQFVQVADEGKIAKLVVEMAARLKAKDANFQVLSPKYGGTVGVDNLNAMLRDRLNPANEQAEWKGRILHVRDGDRVMVVQNDYKRSIYNGDLGKVTEILRDHLVVRIHGIGGIPDMIVDIPKDEADEKLRLAYCVTVHRSQGNEFDTVIMPMVRTQGLMLQRNLFYTAVTRAKQKVWILGEPMAVQSAIDNAKVRHRNTVFGDLISKEHASGVEKRTEESNVREEVPARGPFRIPTS